MYAVDDKFMFRMSLHTPTRLHCSDSAKRHWMISLPGMQWGRTGSLDMLEHEEMRSPTSSEGTALL